METVKEINTKIAELKKKIVTLRSEKILGTMKDTTQIKKTRKEIARLNTKLSQMSNGS